MLIKFSRCSASGVVGTRVQVGGYLGQGSLYSNFIVTFLPTGWAPTSQ